MSLLKLELALQLEDVILRHLWVACSMSIYTSRHVMQEVENGCHVTLNRQ